ncbi:MAG: phage tail family protein [Clostridia bacterium]|nr:phage tail family protein [Clostridia bacterium]
MLNIAYRNMLGTVQLCGGENPLLALLWVSGLSLPNQKETAFNYAGTAGQKVTAVTDLFRDITLAGHGTDNAEQLAEALKILYTPGELIFTSDSGVRTISARYKGVSDRKMTEQGVYYLEFSFRCDTPYFKDGQAVLCEVFQRKGLLKTHFILPCSLSERITEGICKNTGDIPAEPIVTVENRGNRTANGFTIRNRGTGKSIVYNGKLAPGEKIIISIPDRTISDGLGKDCLLNLATDCYLSEFILPAGENRFIFTAEEGMWCDLVYETGYVQNVL